VRVRVDVRLKSPVPERPRFEMKMVADERLLPRVQSWLRQHPDGFYERHPSRMVNSVYFDTPDMHRFVENLGGASERRKVRLRWYGERATGVRPVFEIKCKRNKIGWKISHRLREPIDIEGSTWRDIRREVRSELDDELRLHLDTSGRPVLIVRYQREYYVTADGVIRATVDYGLQAFDQRHARRPNLRFPEPMPRELIIELKGPSDQGDRMVEAIASIPLRVTKRSKYALGVGSALGY